MALDALWAVLNPEVSGVSRVQAPIHAGLRDTPAVLPEVSGVSGGICSLAGDPTKGGIDTSDTSRFSQGYQPKPSIHAGCTLDTLETPRKINAGTNVDKNLLLAIFSLLWSAYQGGAPICKKGLQ